MLSLTLKDTHPLLAPTRAQRSDAHARHGIRQESILATIVVSGLRKDSHFVCEAWNRSIFRRDHEPEQRGAEHDGKQRRLTPLFAAQVRKHAECKSGSDKPLRSDSSSTSG